MTTNSYYPGTEVRLTADFTVLGVATDPTTVTCKVKDPTGTETSYTPTRDGVGAYHQDIFINLAGTWYYRFEGTGACTVASENKITGTASNF